MALPSFTPLDAKLYKWRPASEPLVWERRACGIENLDGLEIPNKKGHNDFFIAVTSHFHEPNLKLDQLVTALKQVWRRTLFHHPQVACSPVWKDGQLFLTYKPPADEEQVAKWIEDTVHCEIRGAIPVEVQQELEDRRRRAGGSTLPSRPVSIHVIPPVSTQNDTISHSDLTFLFHLNHIFLDGSGAYSLIGLVLQDLALQVSTARGSPQQFNWEESVHRLPPAFIGIIRSDQHLSGPSYDTALHQALADTMASQSSWGLKPSGTSSGAARNDFHVISAAHTDRIKSAARRAGINITHLTHAAVFLVGLRSNPPRKPTENKTRSLIASYFALDDRQYIDDKFQTHRKLYIPNCHGHGNIKVNDIHKYVLGTQATPEEVCAKLIAIAKHLKHGYDACAQRPSRVAASLALMEILAGMIAAPYVRNPNPPDTLMTTPLLISDGVYDRWIPPEIISTSTKSSVISNREVRLYANNYQTFPSFHIWSFRSRCTLAVQFDEGFYTAEEMAGYLRDIANMLLVFAGIQESETSML